jgi:hypothetical protein
METPGLQNSQRAGAIAMPRSASARRVVAQGDSLQRAEEITRGKRAGCGRDQRVHSNPATLVALIASYPVLNSFVIRNHRWPH